MWERIPVDRPGNESRARLDKYRRISLDVRLSVVDGEGNILNSNNSKFLSLLFSVVVPGIRS